ncbi:hypothetical protein Ahy_B07g086891 isoform A [Arachis hypogaea]|uniref:Peptidase A2 domain-containing protein n=1 Tax=Arachis hypogaea TaxID=3818 RepID=A0A444YAV6_ARAHY|nr:hypothetical protein Ahy_B07g086891 isoform A [Arachis hypogaea]
MEGRLKFDDGKKEMKVDTDPFDAEASFAEPYFGVNMVGMPYDFDVALDDFESQVRSVYPRAEDGLLDFLVQQKIKDRDVSLCPRNFIIDMLFINGTQSGNIEDLIETNIPITVVELGDIQGNKKPQSDKSKGATPSVHSRIVFPSDGETCPKGISSPEKLEKGKAIAHSSGIDKGKEADLDEEYFEEGDNEIVRTISIIPTEYLGEYEGYFLRPTEKQKSHLCPLHITTSLSGIKVNKILIDGGVAISLLPERMLMKVGKHPDDLVPTNIAFSHGLSFSLLRNANGVVSRTADFIVEVQCIENKDVKQFLGSVVVALVGQWLEAWRYQPFSCEFCQISWKHPNFQILEHEEFEVQLVEEDWRFFEEKERFPQL